MILEAINSVFFTFLVTEYLLAEQDIGSSSELSANNYQNIDGGNGTFARCRLIQIFRRTGVAVRCSFGVLLCLNLFAHFHISGAAISTSMHHRVEKLFHIPRILIAITSFLIVLYFDCRWIAATSNATNTDIAGKSSNIREWSNQIFCRQLLQSFCILLPVYPFLAVIISFGFLFVVTIFEKLHWPTDVLNMPVYYGTLYGPLSYIYWDVKKKIAARRYVNGGSGVLGGSVLPR
eukprot:CCRYP_012158-RA/>CCRYP_012158-RA protein AED:0.14 eAED:0.14 QI:171/1/1/1/0/0/2/453/233